MKFYRFVPAVATALVLSLSSCESEPEPAPEPVDPMPVEDSKEFVASVAQEFMGKFKAADQQELITLLNHIESNYGYLEMPEEFVTEEEAVNPYRNIARSAQIIDLATNYTGVYVPGGGVWVKERDSKDLVFRADDAKYGTIELKVTRSTSNSEVNYDEYEVIVPNTITAVLTATGKTMLTEVIETTFNQNAGTLTATETITAANLKCVAKVNATNSVANANTTFTVNNETLITAKATLNGSNMCNIDAINNAVNNEDFASILKSGNFSGDIMGKIQVQGNVSFSNALFEAWGAYYYYYSSPYGSSELTQEQASQYCDNDVKILNNNVSAWVTFNGASARQATLSFIKDSWTDEWDGYVSGEYEAIGVITFPDGTTYTDEFFETGFDAVVNQWESLLNSYENLWQ